MILTSVMLFIHGSNAPIYISDYEDDDGKLISIGARAAGAIAKREAIHYVSEDGVETIIPFHAITGINIAKGVDTLYVKPTDDFCKAMECPTTPMCDAEEAGDEGEDEGEGQ